MIIIALIISNQIISNVYNVMRDFIYQIIFVLSVKKKDVIIVMINKSV